MPGTFLPLFDISGNLVDLPFMALVSQPENQKPNLVSSIPGPKSQALRQVEDRYLAPGLQSFALLSGIVVKEGHGSVVTDVDGNSFLDIIGGIGVNGLGHSHPKYVRALGEQLEKISVGSFTSEARIEFLERLSRHAPHGVDYRVQLYSSGAEAVESALRLAKSYTKKHEFIGFWGGFHGKTMGVLSLMGSDFKKELGPLVPGNHLVPYANCFRCPIALSYPSCRMGCVDLIREQIARMSTGDIAAIIVEPMQGTAGNVIPPMEFLPALRKIADELGALLIMDEMITGFGRTGKFWGCDHSGVTPDCITIGKQFGGGFPVSGLMARKEICDAEPWSLPSGSSSSYGGNPLAAAAANAALTIIEEEDLVENSRRVGRFFLEKLKPMESRYPFVGTVRGLGLLLAIEFVKDKDSKEPLPKAVTREIFSQCLQRGLLTMSYVSSFRIQPAMTIDEKTVENAVAILYEALDFVAEKRLWVYT